MVRGLFKRKKKEQKVGKQIDEVRITDLERVCSNDKKTCKALWHTMFYDPRKIDTTLENAVKKATDFEKKGSNTQTRIWYHIAGGLALWKDDVAKVKQYFGKCVKLAPEMDYELITEIPEKAVAKAQEFYEKFLQ